MQNHRKISAIIKENCKFKGNLSFNSITKITKIVNKSIFSNNTIIISKNTIINADISTNIIIISKTIKGNIKTANQVEIIKPTRFEDVITTPNLIIKEKVIFHNTTKIRKKN